MGLLLALDASWCDNPAGRRGLVRGCSAPQALGILCGYQPLFFAPVGLGAGLVGGLGAFAATA